MPKFSSKGKKGQKPKAGAAAKNKVGKGKPKKQQFVVEDEDGEGPITYDMEDPDSDADFGDSDDEGGELNTGGRMAEGEDFEGDEGGDFEGEDEGEMDVPEFKGKPDRKRKLDKGDEDMEEMTEETLKRMERQLPDMKNKIRRQQRYQKVKQEKRKLKRKRQEDRKRLAEEMGDDAPEPQKPKTIESMREEDITTVKEDDVEAKLDIENDEFKHYFERSYEPKVLITTSDNPHVRTMKFMRMLEEVIPNSTALWRNRSSVKKICKKAVEKGYTDVLIVNEDNRVPNGLLVCHLPDGPTAHFRISNVKMPRKLEMRTKHELTTHRPEVILNSFTTRLGQGVSRMLAALFHYDPQFRGRRVVTFHNQRDYIFFRHHRYEFKNEKKVSLRELGPRFTLRLKALQKGVFDSITGEYEWIITNHRHEMETSRRRFYL